MIGASSLSGDTLIACHLPLLPIPAWQLPVQALCGSNRRPGSSGLPRAASLPEQDRISQEHPIAPSSKNFSNSLGSLNEDRVEDDEEDGNSDCISASSPEETGKEEIRARGTQRSHNSFLPNPDLDEDDDYSDGDNLHKYHEDSSFVLHGTCIWNKSTDDDAIDRNIVWGCEDLLQAERPHISISDVNALVEIPDHISCCIHNQHKSSSEMFPNCQTDYASDSSCGSSDGILVNFCTMYNRSNNPALLHDLNSPEACGSQSAEGSVFLNLQPLPSERNDQMMQSPLKEDPLKTTSCWSPQDLDSNHTLYSIEHQPPPGLSSLEASDLNACLQSQTTLVTRTNQKYYKLVTCDLLSRSPSGTWSIDTSCIEDQSISGPENHVISPKDQQREYIMTHDYHLASTSEENPPSRTDNHIQNRCQMPCLLCFNHSCTCQSTSSTTAPKLGTSNQEQCQIVEGTSLTGLNKPQRPTSLPIQPIVLDKRHAKTQQLGCLVEQYMKQKNSKKTCSSQPGLKLKSKPYPVDDHFSIFLGDCSSSDTCSTCSPSPDCVTSQNMWSQPHYSPRTTKTSKDLNQTNSKFNQDTHPQTGSELLLGQCQPKFVRIPTYQDLVSLSTPIENHQRPGQSHNQSFFESTYPDTSAHNNNPDQENILPKTHQPQGFSLSAALSSVAPLSSLGSLLSIATSGLKPQQDISEGRHDEPLLMNDLAATDISPDTSYESLSISHLQRRGLLRSVSRAVDLIIAHFGNSRDPEEKIRLGNSYLSAMMASLVLDHLCPAIQNILEDGLKDHKLDVVVGQRRNSSWIVVEVSTKPGPSTKALHSLVCKIINCPQLSSHSMRLKAFIMGLLNLRALEFWLGHLHSQRRVVTSHYHGWGFLSMSLGRCRPLFQELLLLLQPLSILPFELDLLLEPKLLRNGQPCSLAECLSPFTPFAGNSARQTNLYLQDSSKNPSLKDYCETSRSQMAFTPAPEQRIVRECLTVANGSSQNYVEAEAPVSVDCRKMEKDNGATASVEVERPCQGGLRWAKLFGAANNSTRLQTSSQSQVKGCDRPSRWLNLDRSHFGFLTESIKSMKP
ncbi:AP-4 complex accessory subunit RUSC2 [Corythoichthys intestinalis]|uniref:AP-4 complex accessory subunit RUSC2 n=1 Tax=Corythoichthys intestinalis TaxID=161448 RepID=UPI0025A5CDF9|nr:AP-4 complex accessory subunit RUSC2 [Corythoichthys intestinalis]